MEDDMTTPAGGDAAAKPAGQDWNADAPAAEDGEKEETPAATEEAGAEDQG